MLGMHICALHVSSPAALGGRRYAKKNNPQINPLPPKMNEKHPRMRDNANSSSRSCSTCETLAVPPARPSRHLVVLAQLLCCRKGFLEVRFLVIVMEGRWCHLKTPGERSVGATISPKPGAQPHTGSGLGRGKAAALATANCTVLLLVFKRCKAWPCYSRGSPGFPSFGKNKCLGALVPFGKGPGWCWHRRASGVNRQRRSLLRSCTQPHVRSPENGKELIPEANLFCSNPVAVTGSPQVLGWGAAADRIAFMPLPGASLSHPPVAGGGERTSEKGRHGSQGLFTSPPHTRGVRR